LASEHRPNLYTAFFTPYTARGSKKKLYIGNLSFYTTEDTLLEVFSEFGKVHDAYIPQDNDRGGSRGFGFVTMDSDAALNAIDGLDGCEIDDRIIAVNEAQMKRKNSAVYGEDEESP
jgi:RNA recognition motif-containing protein